MTTSYSHGASHQVTSGNPSVEQNRGSQMCARGWIGDISFSIRLVHSIGFAFHSQSCFLELHRFALFCGPDVDDSCFIGRTRVDAFVVMFVKTYLASPISWSDAGLRKPLAELCCIEVHIVCLPHPEWFSQQLSMIQLMVLRAGSIFRLCWSCLCSTEWFHMCYQHVNVCYFILLFCNCFDRLAFPESLWVEFLVFVHCGLLSRGCELRFGRSFLEFIS